ncbi:uncharacterized protein ACWYII_031744 [Salvelinus alpinus]
MINGNRMHLSSILSLIAKGLNTNVNKKEEGPEVLLVKEDGCEEGPGNPEGTMVMEDNQTTPPSEPTEEPAEQHRTTHSLTEVVGWRLTEETGQTSWIPRPRWVQPRPRGTTSLSRPIPEAT